MKKFFPVILVSMIIAVSCTGKKQVQKADVTLELGEAWMSDSLFRTPESVIYDSSRDRLYISNVNFEPRKKDGNGFISIISTEGDIINLKWIENLSSPKGMAINGDTLFVTDVDEVVLIDIAKSEIIRKIPVDSAGMLNDITKDRSGNLYISDTDRNKIHIYSGGKISEWLSRDLKGPNGLLAEENRLLIAFQGNGELVSADWNSKELSIVADSLNRGDGIVFTGIGEYYVVTDWEGEIFLIVPGQSRMALLKTSEHGINTADIEYIKEKNLLLVPTFFKNRVIAFTLRESSQAEEN